MSKEVGRPTVMTEITLKKLEDAFSNGASDKEACFIANISHQTLYDYQKKHPEFIERKEGLKDMIKYQAKSNIAKAINGKDKESLDTAKWYVERKIKKEFGANIDLTTDGKELQPVLVKYLDDENKNN